MTPYFLLTYFLDSKKSDPPPLPPQGEKERKENMLRIGSDAKNDELEQNLVDSEHVVN